MLTEAAARLDAFSFHDLEVGACWGSCRRAHPAGYPPRRRLAAPDGPLRRVVLGPSGYRPRRWRPARRPALAPGQAHS
jgi:hypothetical protein